VVPPLYIASDALLGRLVDYVRAGGHLVLTLKSGFCDEYSTVRHEMAPGPLREAAGFHYQEFSNLEKPLALKGDPFQAARGKPRERLGGYAAARQGQGAGLLRSSVFRKVSGHYGEPFRQGHGDLRRRIIWPCCRIEYEKESASFTS
jgi:hypothetical protein